MNDVFTQFLQMPEGVKGLVLPTPDGDYQIIINAAYNRPQRLEIFNHEMRHLLLGHHQQQGAPLRQLEEEAADKTQLLAAIKRAEENGLPLETAIFRPAADGAGQAPQNAPPGGPAAPPSGAGNAAPAKVPARASAPGAGKAPATGAPAKALAPSRAQRLEQLLHSARRARHTGLLRGPW